MKTTLLTAVLALSPGFAFSTFAQDKKPDAPREEQKEAAIREQRQQAETQAREAEAKAREAAPARAHAEMEKKVQAVLQEAAKLDEAGKKDAAENLRREAREMAQAVKARAHAASEGRREGDDKKPDAPRGEHNDANQRERIEAAKEKGHAEIEKVHAKADLENKLKHLEQAIGHLHEAGLTEPAEHLTQLANRYRSVLRGEGEPRREEPRREEGRREEGRREEPGREESKREMRRPDNDIEALRREIQELRQAVRQLNERKSGN